MIHSTALRTPVALPESTTPLKVIAIDPGITHCGYAVLRAPETLELSGTWIPRTTLRGVDRHLWLLSKVQDMIAAWQPSILAYEDFTWRSDDRYLQDRAAFERIIGGIQTLSLMPPYPVLVSLLPAQWGQQLIGSRSHTKADVARVINLRLGTSFKGDIYDNHACDAVGIGLVAMDNLRLTQAALRAGGRA